MDLLPEADKLVYDVALPGRSSPKRPAVQLQIVAADSVFAKFRRGILCRQIDKSWRLNVSISYGRRL